MKLRTITLGVNNENLFTDSLEKEVLAFFKTSNDIFNKHNLSIRTTRISFEPYRVSNECSDVEKS